MNTELNEAKPASQTTKVSDQTEAVGLYLQGLFNKPSVINEVSAPEEQKDIDILPEGRPDWSAKPFQALFIDINGMDIAIPMSSMSGIRQYPVQLTNIPNTAPWIKGIHLFHDRKIQVIDAHRLLMPEGEDEKQAEQDKKKIEFIVQIGDGRWGLACCKANHSRMVQPEQIRWSGDARRKRWILGMVKDPLCALLDVEEFIHYLDQGAPQYG